MTGTAERLGLADGDVAELRYGDRTVGAPILAITGHAEGSVTATLANGDTVLGTALIGADGLWSNIRRKLVGDAASGLSGLYPVL